jgi:hypothetical protein
VQATRFNRRGELEAPEAFEKNAGREVLARLTLVAQWLYFYGPVNEKWHVPCEVRAPGI